ncbi:hypothetical protein X777_08028 [Ooceraea biroi]|uniref:Uncharacterized protein n=1 Tax=Ooceraea biroi TaxID=2015173 RepID=A0A026WBW1_OOCBI|nr:hypothetical protein X777_08028 [Ooceraea biroi]
MPASQWPMKQSSANNEYLLIVLTGDHEISNNFENVKARKQSEPDSSRVYRHDIEIFDRSRGKNINIILFFKIGQLVTLFMLVIN